MTTLGIIEQHISALQKNLKILKRLQKYSQKEIEGNDIVKGAVERYLYLLVQDGINLSEATIAFRNFRRPDTYAEAFRILQEEKLISPALSEKMVQVAKFRNVIAHDYKKIDYKIIYDVLQDGLKDIEQFIGEIKKALKL